MGFLQLNWAQPSQKRPFRIMDLQDIWSAIGQIFAQKNDSEARIVSGFDRNTNPLEPAYPTAGVIAYKGDLYTYDPDNYGSLRFPGFLPSDPGAPDLYLAKFSTGDMRQLGNGDTITFSYLFVCGADRSRFTGAEEIITLTNFIDKVEGLKSYIGNGTVTAGKIGTQAVTTNKIADQAVTTNKIADQAVTTEKIGYAAVGRLNLELGNRLRGIASTSLTITQGATYNLSSLVYPDSVQGLVRPVDTTTFSCTLNLMYSNESWPYILPIRIAGLQEDDEVRLLVPSSVGSSSTTLILTAEKLNGATTMLLCKYKEGYVPLGIY